MECAACGRRIVNDAEAPNAAAWTLTEPRLPYCADSEDCRRDVESSHQAVTAQEIEAARTSGGGWTRQQLAEWGVSWPPPKGWKGRLAEGAP